MYPVIYTILPWAWLAEGFVGLFDDKANGLWFVGGSVKKTNCTTMDRRNHFRQWIALLIECMCFTNTRDPAVLHRKEDCGAHVIAFHRWKEWLVLAVSCQM